METVVIAPASKHVKDCHAGLDPASGPIPDSRFRGNDDGDTMQIREQYGDTIRHDVPILFPVIPLFGLILLLPLLVAWGDSWEGLREASRRVTSVEARFVQKKSLPMLAKPFVSEGRFFFQAPGSLRWEYDRPVRSVLIMNGGVVKRYLRDPNGWREDAGASLTAMRVVLEEIVNWQQGRFDANPRFQASLSADPEPRVTLVPREPSWGKMIRRIEMTFSREQAGVMKSVRLVEDERSFTDLDFSQVRTNRPLPASLFVNVE
jgi:outer membrane lipoprotein-sorting protein